MLRIDLSVTGVTLLKVNIFLQKNRHADDRIIACFRFVTRDRANSKELIDGLQPADRSIIHSLLKTEIDTRYDTQINVETQRLQRHDRFAMISSLLWRRYVLHVYKSGRFSFRDRISPIRAISVGRVGSYN